VHGFTTAFWVSAGIMALALVVVAALIRRPTAPGGEGAGAAGAEAGHVVELEPVLAGV
jgi:hypothetical protein